MGEIQDQDNIIINHILLIYKHYMYMSRKSESLNFIGLKNYILETKTLEEKIGQNDPNKKRNFFYKMAGYRQYVTRRLILKK